jgi:ATP-dependent DNA ligase
LVVGKPGLQYNGHDTGDGELILKHAGKLGFEGVVSKTIDAPYAPGNRGLWRKAKALNRQEFVVVGWSDPEGSRPHVGALLLGYYTDDGKLTYAGRVGTGKPVRCLPIFGAAWTRPRARHIEGVSKTCRSCAAVSAW